MIVAKHADRVSVELEIEEAEMALEIISRGIKELEADDPQSRCGTLLHRAMFNTLGWIKGEKKERSQEVKG